MQLGEVLATLQEQQKLLRTAAKEMVAVLEVRWEWIRDHKHLTR